MKFFSNTVALALAICVVAVSIVDRAAADEGWRFDDASRIVAVADVHGAYASFESILRQAGLIGDALQWQGGDSDLVIVGDLLDRGPDSRRAMDLVMRLEREAPDYGGRVHMLLGNHEVMNLTGDLRYVSPAEYAAFAADESADARAAAFAQYLESQPDGADEAAARAAFDARYPAGFFAHRAAFSEAGIYGAWLSGQPALVVIGDWAFVHGGLVPSAMARPPAELNAQFATQLSEYMAALAALTDAGVLEPDADFYDQPARLAAFGQAVEAGEASWPAELAEAAESLITLQAASPFASDGPIWYRGNVGCSRLIEEDRLLGALDAVGAGRLVVGHTPTENASVIGRMDGRLLRLDTGMLNEYYGGRAAALVVEGERVSAIYEGEPNAAAPLAQPRRVGTRPAGMNADGLERYLESAEVLSVSDVEGGFKRVSLVRDGVELEAYFFEAPGRNFMPDVAAYRLDRLLDLEMVPVTVMREIEGRLGSLQYMPAGTIDEVERGTRRLGGAAWCPLRDQINAMYVFDSLIYNSGRTADRIRYATENFQVILIGHDAAFDAVGGRPQHLAEVDLTLTEAWVRALASLDEDMLNRSLGDLLDRRRIRALLGRRDDLLEIAGQQ